MHEARLFLFGARKPHLRPAFDAGWLFRERSRRRRFHLRCALLWLCHFSDELRCHRVATVATEDDQGGFPSGLGKRTEVRHRLAASVADSGLGLIRITHFELLHDAAAVAVRKPPDEALKGGR